MKFIEYKQIVSYISQRNDKKKALILQLHSLFPNVETDTLHSIHSQRLQRKVKANFRKHYKPNRMQLYYERCMRHVSDNKDAGVILQIAEEVDFPPVMLARIIIEEHLKRTKYRQTETVPKSQISLLLKNPKNIEDDKLKNEIELCLEEDEDFGPGNDAIKRNIGEAFETRLANILTEKDIPFICEDKLRSLGYDKTPDFKLEVPIALQGCVVNWIESKASFGDEESNSMYLEDQFWSYTNRFGPGMVIYWFDFIDELDVNRSRGIILCNHFPNEIVTLDTLL